MVGRGLRVGWAADVPRPAASVCKLFVAIAALIAGRDGGLDLDATVAVADLPPTCNPSVTSALRPDHRLSIDELAGLMLATSDNRIADHLVAMVGPATITDAARTIGARDTVVSVGFDDEHLGPSGRANLTTASDCARALHAIAVEATFDAIRPALRSSLFNTRILSALPDEIVVSHKTGTLTGVVNDVGTMHAPGGDLIVCFLTDGQADHAATSAAIGQCARAVLDAAVAFDGSVGEAVAG